MTLPAITVIHRGRVTWTARRRAQRSRVWASDCTVDPQRCTANGGRPGLSTPADALGHSVVALDVAPVGVGECGAPAGRC
jgi:hypothetical protein